MHPTDDELRKAVALFRYGLIADVLGLPPGSRDIRRALREKAQRTYVIPGTRRSRIAVETMRDWLYLYRNGGFEALYCRSSSNTSHTVLSVIVGCRHRFASRRHCSTSHVLSSAYERPRGRGTNSRPRAVPT